MTSQVAKFETECVTGADPFASYHVPIGYGDFYQASDLQDIAEVLIERRFKNWPQGESAPTVSYFWKSKGGAKGGKGIFGKLSKATGLVGALLNTEYVLWLAADLVRDSRYSNFQVEALLYHEMLHIAFEVEDPDEKGEGRLKYTTRAHDVEAFSEEVETYGFWDGELKGFSRAVQGRLRLEA